MRKLNNDPSLVLELVASLSVIMQDLQFLGNNPGAVKHGNFINYYNFNPPENRLKLLPKSFWNQNEVFYGLDIGCNAGDLTISLYDTIRSSINRECHIIGVDIDPILITRAQDKTDLQNINFECLDFMNDDSRQKLLQNYMQKHNINKFSVTFGFSLTMWIHLNNGDLGLQKFLKTVCEISDFVLLEPQPWKCYKSAVKRMKQQNHSFAHYEKLKFRDSIEDIIDNLMTSYGAHKVFETQRTKWNRKIVLYKCK